MASPQVANQNFPSFRTALNNIITSLDTVKSGSVAPTDFQAYTSWLDTSTSPPVLKIRNGANSAWINILQYLGNDASEADWFIDEDSFTTNSAVLVPSQQSVKAYVDAQTTGLGGTTLNQIIVEDQKAGGTAGGNFTSGAWRTRDLNTIVNDVNGNAALASNQITLTAGDYGLLTATACAYGVTEHQVALYSVTDNAYAKYGTSEYSSSTGTRSILQYYIGTLAVDTTIELRHQCQQTRSFDGRGRNNTFGGGNVYAQVVIEDLN